MSLPVGRHCEVRFLRFTSILVVLTANLEVYCKTKQSSLLITFFILLNLSLTAVPNGEGTKDVQLTYVTPSLGGGVGERVLLIIQNRTYNLLNKAQNKTAINCLMAVLYV